MNNVLLVGRLVRVPELRKTETGKTITNITLAVTRPFKDLNGFYQTDFIDCIVWEATAKRIIKYCLQGDLLGIKGRIQIAKEDTPEFKKNITQVVVENLSMLAHANYKETNVEEDVECNDNLEDYEKLSESIKPEQKKNRKEGKNNDSKSGK